MFKRLIQRVWWRIMPVLFFVALFVGLPLAAAEGDPPLVWTWRLPAYTFSAGGGALSVPGWPSDGCPGSPLLPYTTTLISLPPDGGVSLTVRILAWEHRKLPVPLVNSPHPPAVLPYGESCAVTSVVTLTPVGVMRGARLANLTYRPFRYDAASGVLSVARSVRVIVRSAAVTRTHSVSEGLSCALRELSRNELLVSPPATLSRAARPITAPLAAVGWFTLTGPGIYRLPFSWLTATGVLSSTFESSWVHLIHGGREVSLRQVSGQSFLFYAHPRATRWAEGERYIVRYGAPPAPRMKVRSGSPAGLPEGVLRTELYTESQRSYLPAYPSAHGGDHWYWGHLTRPGARDWQTTVHLLPPVAGMSATLTLWLQGDTAMDSQSPDHRVAVSVRGRPLGATSWDGAVGVTVTLPVSTSLLSAGGNSITLSLPGLSGVSLEGAWLDAISLRYPVAAWGEVPLLGMPSPHAYELPSVPLTATVYDISVADDPRVVSGGERTGDTLAWGDEEGQATYFIAAHTYTVPQLTPVPVFTEPSGADYIAIAPKEFWEALRPLLSLRQSQGLSTFLGAPEAIYAAYGDGRMSPEAIRDFVAHAYASWSPRPAYLLLVGDGTWDPLHHLGNDTQTLIPPYLVMADPLMGEVPADNRYVTVEGDDLLPDLAVGRLPVNSPPELMAMVDKIVTYETRPQPGDWNLRHVFVADDPDGGGNFPLSADAVAARVPVSHTLRKIYCQDAPDDDPLNPYCANVAQLRPQVLVAWDEGALLFSWFGHSSFQQWEHGRLFHTDDLHWLHNARRWPVMLSMTCYTGHFAHPDPLQTSLDEALARLPQAGAVASWGSSGEGYRQHHLPLALAFYDVAFDPVVRLGEAMAAAKAALAGSAAAYLIDTYHLFGDPAMRLHLTFVPWPEQVFCPLITK